MIFCRKPKIEFHNVIKGLDEIYSIKKSSSLLPDWWKKTNPNDGQRFYNGTPLVPGNIKKCPGISDFLLDGHIIPAWTDMFIDPTQPGPRGDSCKIDVAMVSQSCTINAFNTSTFREYLPPQIKCDHIIRIQTPWAIKTSSGHSIQILDPFYFFNTDFVCAPGILDTDAYHSLSVQLMVKSDKPFIIPFGSPLCIVRPFKREKYTSKIFKKNEKGDSLFTKSFFIKSCKFLETSIYNSIRKNKCPF